MPKNWPSDTIRRQKGRQKNQPILELRGWNYFECNKLSREMFYRYVKEPGQSVGMTEAVCVSCSAFVAKD